MVGEPFPTSVSHISHQPTYALLQSTKARLDAHIFAPYMAQSGRNCTKAASGEEEQMSTSRCAICVSAASHIARFWAGSFRNTFWVLL